MVLFSAFKKIYSDGRIAGWNFLRQINSTKSFWKLRKNLMCFPP